MADFLLAAWFSWMTPLQTALSSFVDGRLEGVLGGASLSPDVGGLAELADPGA